MRLVRLVLGASRTQTDPFGLFTASTRLLPVLRVSLDPFQRIEISIASVAPTEPRERYSL